MMRFPSGSRRLRARRSSARQWLAGALFGLAADGPVAPSLSPAGSATQLDVGSFTTYVDGRRAGREQFSLQGLTSPDGPTFELRMESAVGERRSAVRLETDSAGTPFRYTVEEREGARVTLRLGGQRVRGRFATLSRGTRGEAAREYLLAPGAIVLEDEGVHQYSMLLRTRSMQRGDSVGVPVLAPIRNLRDSVRLVLDAAADTITIASSPLIARRWRVVSGSGDRTIWADDQGRILRLSIPSRRFDALRDDVPR